jgi:hypothetical protein
MRQVEIWACGLGYLSALGPSTAVRARIWEIVKFQGADRIEHWGRRWLCRDGSRSMEYRRIVLETAIVWGDRSENGRGSRHKRELVDWRVTLALTRTRRR